MKDKKNTYIVEDIVWLSVTVVVISVIAIYFQVKELYPVVYPLAGLTCYWLIKLYQHMKNKNSGNRKIVAIVI